MANYHLSSFEIRELISRYESELGKLKYQVEKTEDTIKELKRDLAAVSTEEKKSPPVVASLPKPEMEEEDAAGSADRKRRKRITATLPKPKDKGRPEKVKGRRGRPPGKKAAAEGAGEGASSGKAAKAPKVVKAAPKASKAPETNKGYRLSGIDLDIMEALETSGHVLITSELLDYAIQKATDRGETVVLEDIKNKISRSLHKMVNRRSDLKGAEFPGRGKAYALPNWFDEDGILKNKYQRKNP